MKLLTLFNHKGDRPLFKSGFESWQRARRLPGDVRVIEDKESTRGVDGVEYVKVDAGSSRMARFHAIKHFVESDYTHCFFLDNDLIYAHHFDMVTYLIWEQFHGHHPLCVASPYRPALAGHTRLERDMGAYVWKGITSDAALFMDKRVAEWMLTAIKWDEKPFGWGFALSACNVGWNGCLVPHRSMVLHVGTKDGGSSFALLQDDGYKFPGEDWTAI